MLSQIVDFRAEADDLHALLREMPDADWARPTRFKQWTTNDIVQHLYDSDLSAMASANAAEEYVARREAIMARRKDGVSRVEETRDRLGNPQGRQLLDLWYGEVGRLCDKLATLAPDARLKWGGPDMGVRMFTTARQMEVWAHGQAIYDLLNRDRAPTPRLKNVAVIGTRTFGWTFVNRGEPVPGDAPHVVLAGVGGETWSFNAPSETNRVEGDAVAFCQVVTQTRNVADTKLHVTGEVAKRWMAVAQCFAGPPETPPVPGTRRKEMAPP